MKMTRVFKVFIFLLLIGLVSSIKALEIKITESVNYSITTIQERYYSVTSPNDKIAKSFKAKIWVFPSSEIKVEEEIDYDFGKNYEHFFYRYIPYVFRIGLDEYEMDISELEVVDKNGNKQHFYSEKSDETVDIRIGGGEKLFTGRQKYIIRYRAKGSFRYLDDKDQLYWSILGEDWTVPIEKVEATFILPDNLPSQPELECFTSSYQGENNNCSYSIDKRAVQFLSLKPICPQEYFVIKLSFPRLFA